MFNHHWDKTIIFSVKFTKLMSVILCLILFSHCIIEETLIISDNEYYF